MPVCLFRKCRPVRRIDEISYNVNLRLIRSSRTCCGADSYTAGQRWVLYMHHVEFTILGDQGRGRECDHTAGRDGEKGVYNGPLLIVSFESGTVERWPEQPQEYRTCRDKPSLLHRLFSLLLSRTRVTCKYYLLFAFRSSSYRYFNLSDLGTRNVFEKVASNWISITNLRSSLHRKFYYIFLPKIYHLFFQYF